MRARKLWLIFLLLQLTAGTIIVMAQRTTITVVEQKMTDDIVETKRRLDQFDALHIAERLAVIDTINDRSWRVELLIIGLVLTTGGHLVFQLWSSQGVKHRHRRADDAQDE